MSRRAESPTAPRRRRRERRACGAVLSGLAAFAVLQLGLAVGVETSLPEVRDPLYGRRLARVRERLREGPVRPWTAVMLGSSRTQRALRPGPWQESLSREVGRPAGIFNFGVAGGGPVTELLTWRRLRRDGVRPDLVLVEVLPAMLSVGPPLRETNEVHLPTNQLWWNDLPLVKRYSDGVRTEMRREWLCGWPAPLYAHRVSLVSLTIPCLLPPPQRLDLCWILDEYGGLRWHEAAVTPELRGQALRQAEAEYRDVLANFRLGGSGCDALTELLASCRRDGVPAALVLMPEGPTFRSWCPPETWRTVRDWVGDVSREYAAPVVDAREWVSEEDFIDSHHLLQRGSTEFMDRLNREYLSPWSRRAGAVVPGSL